MHKTLGPTFSTICLFNCHYMWLLNPYVKFIHKFTETTFATNIRSTSVLLLLTRHLARDAFFRTNRRDCHDVRPSVCLYGTGVHCDHTVHALARIQVYGWVVQCCAHPDTKACPPTPSRLFSSSTWKTGGVWMCKLGVISQERLKIEVKLLLSANRK